MLTASACAQLNEAIHPRDLECGEVPDDICTRMANHIVSLWDPANLAESGPVVKVTVTPDCPGFPITRVPDAVRCFEVGASPAGLQDGTGPAGIGGYYFLLVDGTLIGPEDAVLGTFPLE